MLKLNYQISQISVVLSQIIHEFCKMNSAQVTAKSKAQNGDARNALTSRCCRYRT